MTVVGEFDEVLFGELLGTVALPSDVTDAAGLAAELALLSDGPAVTDVDDELSELAEFIGANPVAAVQAAQTTIKMLTSNERVVIKVFS